MKYFLFFLIVVTCLKLNAQNNKRNNNWVVGFVPAVKFNFNSTLVIDTFQQVDAILSSTSISDTNGSLILFSSGFVIGDGNGFLISNGDKINCAHGDVLYSYYGGGSPFDQSSIILPKKSNSYYVLSTGMSDSVANNYIGGIKQEFDVLNYSIVDMDSNVGLGKVTEKNIILLDHQHYWNTALTAVRHGNGKDWWLVKADCLNNILQLFLVREDTILGPTNVIMNNTGDFCAPYSQIYFSDDGKKFASSLYGTLDGAAPNQYKNYNRVDVYDFDRCNGQFTFNNYYKVPYDTSSYPYFDVKSGICFSPDAQLLYMCNWYSVYQIDLNDTNKSNAIFISGPDTTIANFPSYRLMACGPNGKMYIGNFDATRKSMSYIDKPNIKGIGCDFIPQGLWQPYTNLLSPPNMPNYGLGKAPIGGNCWPENTVNFELNEYFKIYPNPTNSFLHIEYPLQDKKRLIMIYDAVGQLILSSSEARIDVSRLSNGMYFVRVDDLVKKFLKE